MWIYNFTSAVEQHVSLDLGVVLEGDGWSGHIPYVRFLDEVVRKLGEYLISKMMTQDHLDVKGDLIKFPFLPGVENHQRTVTWWSIVP